MNALGIAALVFALGFGLAWHWQGRDLDAAEAVIAARDAAIEDGRKAAAKLHEETSDAWARNLERVRGDSDAFRRCVAAGRCGPVADRVCEQTPVPGGSGTLPPAGGTDAAESNAVLVTRGFAADCAVTTLQLNTLQAAIEKQKGY